MPYIKDITGQKFGRLIALSKTKQAKNGEWYWLCKCDCGNETEVTGGKLRFGWTTSCGCAWEESVKKYENGYLSYGQFYTKWQGLKQRCSSKEKKKSKIYYERGIQYCEDWLVFENFEKDMYASYLAHIKTHGDTNTSLDRIDNNLGYFKENCRWVTIREQQNNKRSNIEIVFKNKTYPTITMFCEEIGIEHRPFRKRIIAKKNLPLNEKIIEKIILELKGDKYAN